MKKTIKFLLCILVIGIITHISINQYKGNIVINKWDNIYNENGIIFFYSNKDDIKIKALDNKYNLSDKIKNEEDELSKAVKLTEILNSLITFDDVPNLNRINGFDILKDKEGSKKVSARDLGIIYRDFLTSVGYKARLGEFKKNATILSRDKNYYIVEYWSREYNKWIMIDFIDRGYFDKENFPCGALEVLESEIRNLNYTGLTKRKDYISKIKNFLQSYTINIDNTTDMSKSNSYLTYIRDEKDIVLKFKDNFIPPTIFTENKELINKNPIDTTVSSDKKAYIILMKKQANDSKEGSFIIGAFKDGKILEEYYIKENELEFRKVKSYSDISLNKGNNKIQLSLNGKDVISAIEIKVK